MANLQSDKSFSFNEFTAVKQCDDGDASNDFPMSPIVTYNL